MPEEENKNTGVANETTPENSNEEKEPSDSLPEDADVVPANEPVPEEQSAE